MRNQTIIGVSALAICGCSGKAYVEYTDTHGDAVDSTTVVDGHDSATAAETSSTDSHVATDSASPTEANVDADAHAPDSLIAFSAGVGIDISSDVAASGKVDLLVEIDNSLSMADKQSELSKRIPAMIDQLVQINPKTSLPYVNDIHVAVITSSLGTYGDGVSATPNISTGWSDVCAYQNSGQVQVLYGNDHGHLLPRNVNSGGIADPGVTGLSGWQMSGSTATQAACPTIAGGSSTLALHWAYQGAGYPTAVAYGVTLESDGNDVANAATLELAASCEVASASEHGCGYENNLESAYHFLIDPHPFNALSGIPRLTGSSSCYAGGGGTANCNIILSPPSVGFTGPIDGKNNGDTASAPNDDAVILTQRANFLRPDSLLAVMFISDEDDASINPTSAGPLTWMPWTFLPGSMFHGTSGCASVDDSNDNGYCNQNGVSCTWCENYTGDVCGSAAAQSDPNCATTWPTTPNDSNPLWNQDRDSNNLRAWNQIQRFGYSFLWPRERYVDGFTQATVTDRFGNTDVNPIFAGGRTMNHLVVASIVGVPDHLVPKELDASTNLQVPLAGDKWASADWDSVVGPLGTRDPHMIESIAERTAANLAKSGYSKGLTEYKGWSATTGAADLSADPPTGATFVQPNTGLTVPYNGNGGERHMIDFVVSSSDASPSDGDFDDLQFACMGQRTVTTASYDCSGKLTWAWQPECDCTGATCSSSARVNGNWGNPDANVTQPRYKAYPGLRYLRMIQSLGSSGYAASICAPSFEPAIVGIVNKIRSVFSGQCFAGTVPQDADGSSNCIMLETIPLSAFKTGVTLSTANACEALGLCTPGAAGCNRSAQSVFPPDQVTTQAAASITLSINTGGSSVQQVTAEMDPAGSGNVIIAADAGAEQMVCEVPQLAGTDLTNCVDVPTATIASTGWCYTNTAAATTAFGCSAGTGDLRMFGAATSQGAGSTMYLECKGAN